MTSAGNTTIVLGVTGSIAAYKAADLASQLTQSGAEVHVIMTDAATKFVAPLTFQALTGLPVGTGMFDEGNGAKIEHISIAREADLVLIAPATADVIAKLAHGMADDLLTAVTLATTAPVIVAPAMNPAMWSNLAVQENVATIKARGIDVLEPEHGTLACGEVGKGRMADNARILSFVRQWRSMIGTFKDVRVLVTAGPTREYIDDVRYISNPSSGKMGYSIAREAVRRGAEVLLVSGPSDLPDPCGAKTVRVTTGEEMRQVVLDNADWAKVIVKCAAVTDYRPSEKRPGKIKDAKWNIALDKVGNILDELAAIRQEGKVYVGFAAEIGDPEPEAMRKLAARGLDLIIANDVTQPDGGFGSDANQATMIYADGRTDRLDRLPKAILAQKILDAVEGLIARPPVKTTS